MITIEDCLALSDLTEEEVDAIASSADSFAAPRPNAQAA